MNVFLVTDLEGIAGVTDIDFVDKTNEKYSHACRLLEQSINLAVDTCLRFGAERVYYLDGHAGGGNVAQENVHPAAERCTIADWEALLRTGGIDCVMELGAHARAGTIGGFLDHTVSSKRWFSYRIDGLEMSELSLHAALCGAYGVPVVACIGDEAACMQAKEYIPEICTGAVKIARTRNVAQNLENADEILVDTIRLALSTYQTIPPYHVQFPATVELTFSRTDFCEKALSRCSADVERVDARTLRKRICEIRRYADLKLD